MNIAFARRGSARPRGANAGLGTCRCLALCLLALLSAPASATDVTVLGLFPNMAVLEVDGRRHTLRVGQATPGGIRLIEADSEAAILEIEGERSTLGLGHQAVNTRFETAEQASAEIWPSRGMYLAGGSINGQPVRFLIDTGASWVAMGPAHAQRLGIDFRSVGTEAWANTAAGKVRVYELMLDRVGIGAIELRNIKAAVIDSPTSGEAILLGMSFLERVEMQHQGAMLELRQKY